MSFEFPKSSGANFENKRGRDFSAKEKVLKYLKRGVIISAVSIASYLGYNKFYSGKDYTDMGSFTKAFQAARKDHENYFYWKEKRYHTDLVSKEFSDNYWESKKFLEDYYKSDYFKQKSIITSLDSFDVSYGIKKTIRENPRYKELEEKMMRGELSFDEAQEYERLDKLSYDDSVVYASDIFKDQIDSIRNNQSVQRLANLHNPSHFAITHQKGDQQEDGYFRPKDKAVYIYSPKELNETTAVHELTHKSTNGNSMLIDNNSYFELAKRAVNSLKLHIDAFAQKHVVEDVDYLTNPTEIDGRQNSVRFWLYKHFAGYKADSKFTGGHFDFLKERYETLPYDIQQLMDLFPDKDVFIDNMNRY